MVVHLRLCVIQLLLQSFDLIIEALIELLERLHLRLLTLVFNVHLRDLTYQPLHFDLGVGQFLVHAEVTLCLSSHQGIFLGIGAQCGELISREH